MKNYFGFVRDHSISMYHIRNAAKRDYNETISSIRESSEKEKQDSIIYTLRCSTGRPPANIWETKNSSVAKLQNLDDYPADGNHTALFDAVKELVETLQRVPDYDDPEVAFLVFVTTDGQDNASYTKGPELARLIKSLQTTDRWTFVFRVPEGDKAALVQLGIPAGNIQEWEQSRIGVETSTAHTRVAFSNYFSGRSRGLSSTSTFYTDLSDVSKRQIKTKLADLSSEVAIQVVSKGEDKILIKDFCKNIFGKFEKGCAFYQLVKREKEVQDYKKIAIVDKKTKSVYGGDAARELLGMPTDKSVPVAPGDHANYELFIQSTSVNRKLPAGSKVLYWENANKY